MLCGNRILRRLLPIVVALAAGVVGVANASAAYPGANGKIAFVSGTPGSYDVYTMNADGSARTQLTSASGDDVDPVWSPDGTKIAFASERDGGLSIYLMDADGSNVTRVTTIPLAFSPSWSPDGTKLAFEGIRSVESGNDADIWLVNEDGSGLTNLTLSDQSWEEYPAWSPDGTRLVFDASDGSDTEIFVMNMDGSNRLQLTDNFDPFRPPGDFLPSWSPDGLKIAFVSERDIVLDPFTSTLSPELYTMNADGSAQTRITTNLFLDSEPAWSPDGTSILFASDDGDEGGLGDLVRIAADGGGRTNLTQTTALDDFGPDWQPLASVPAYGFAGFFAPVSNQPTLNKTNAGKTIPVKFSLGGDQGLEIFAAEYPQSQSIDCTSREEIGPLEQADTAGSSSLTYHPESERYDFAWQTSETWAGTCRRLVISLADGSFHQADFKL